MRQKEDLMKTTDISDKAAVQIAAYWEENVKLKSIKNYIYKHL